MIYLTIEDKKNELLELVEEVAHRIYEQRDEIARFKNTQCSENEFVGEDINYFQGCNETQGCNENEFVDAAKKRFQDCDETNFNKKVRQLQNFQTYLGKSYLFLQKRVKEFAEDTKGPKKKVRFAEDDDMLSFFASIHKRHQGPKKKVRFAEDTMLAF